MNLHNVNGLDSDMYIVTTSITYLEILSSCSYTYISIRASVDALSRDGTDMRGDAQNPKSFQAPRM